MMNTQQKHRCVHMADDRQFHIDYVAPEAAAGMYFDQVQPRLHMMQQKTGDVIDYEWIDGAIKDGLLQVWRVCDKSDTVGIVITQEIIAALTGQKGLLIVALHADKGLNITEFLAKSFDEIAAFFDYHFIWAQTVRKGWKNGIKYGWKQRGYAWGIEYGGRR